LQRWLHQHIFKVGWLVTKKLQTTTTLFYAFFLPGIFLHELTRYLMAGLLNVRADRTIAWPQKQEIGELRLTFIRLTKSVSPVKLALITLAPTAAGLIVIGLIANNIFDFAGVTALIRGGFVGNVTAALHELTDAPDFWLWFYLVFTVSNTFLPANLQDLRGLWWIIAVLGAIFVALLLIGVGDQVMSNAINGPMRDGVNTFSSLLTVILAIDLFMVVVLGTLEALIERITGNSATFKNGRMITLRRSELLAQRAAEAARHKSAPLTRQSQHSTPHGGPPSVYRLSLPIPGAPGREATRVEGQIIGGESQGQSRLSAAPRSTPPVVAGSLSVPSSSSAVNDEDRLLPDTTDDEDESG
jgi:hypothetical protein